MEKVSEPEEGGGAGEAGEAGAPAGVCVMISLLYVRSCHERGKVCSDRAWTYRRTKDGLLSGATGRSEEVQRLGCELGGEEPWEGCPCHLWGPRGHRGT